LYRARRRAVAPTPPRLPCRAQMAAQGAVASNGEPSSLVDAQLPDLADRALAEAERHFDDRSSSWSLTKNEGDIELWEQPMAGAAFPMYRSALTVANQKPTSLTAVASTVCSAFCRRFYDSTFDRACLLRRGKDDGEAVIGLFAKPTPITPATFFMGVFGIKRSTADSGSERITVACSRAPDEFDAPLQEQLAACGAGGEIKRSSTRLWAFDVQYSADGALRMSMLVAIERNASWLPAFVIKQFLADSLVAGIDCVWQMSRAGMIPRSVVSFWNDEAPEHLQECAVAGGRVFVSTSLLDAFAR